VVKTWSSAHEILCAALGACAAITLRMYAARKDWQQRSGQVDVHLELHGKDRSVTRQVRVILTRPSGRDWRTSLSAHPLR